MQRQFARIVVVEPAHLDAVFQHRCQSGDVLFHRDIERVDFIPGNGIDLFQQADVAFDTSNQVLSTGSARRSWCRAQMPSASPLNAS
jgi:hypothetical protein